MQMNFVTKKGKSCSIYIHLINNHRNGSLAFSIQIILAHNTKKHTTSIRKLKEQPKSSQTLLLISGIVPCCMAGSKHRA